MHITYLYDGAYPSTGADAWQVLNTVTALSRQQVQVTLICAAPGDRAPLTVDALARHYDLRGSFELVQLRRPRGMPRTVHKWWHCTAALRHPRARASDLVYSRNLPAVMTALAHRRRVVYDTYRPWPEQYRAMRVLFERLFADPDLLGAFFHSGHARDAYAALDIDPRRLCVAHNGFHPELFRAAPGKADARAEVGLPPERFIVGYTGRLDREKGIEALLDLADAMPDLTVFLAGGGSDDDVLARAAATANVTLLPWQKPGRMPTLLSACDVLMIPSSSAALRAGNTVLPMKIFEYLASGRPIVAPRSPDTAEVLHHGENAWLVESDRLDTLVAEVKRLRADGDLRETLARGARASADRLTWDARGEKLVAHITRWLELRSGAPR